MILTEPMRAWLRRPEVATMICWEMVRAFREQFGLTGREAGDALAQWIRETC